jgi:hypothetical protein
LQLDTGICKFFGFDFNDAPSETSFGDGESGFEKGCARLVAVEVVGPAVRGEVGVAVVGSRDGHVDENVRANVD